jgi:signal peptidase I
MSTPVTSGPDVTTPDVPEKSGTSGRHRPAKPPRSQRHAHADDGRVGATSGYDEVDVIDDEPRSLLRRLFSGTATLCLVALLVVLVIAVGGTALGYRAALIRSGSMTPTLAVGSMVVTKPIPATDFKPGDIVTFHSAAVGNDLVTHRVITVKQNGARVDFMTKGDANMVTEQWHVTTGTKLGKTLFHLNFVGRIMAVIGNKFARIAALLIGAITLLYVLFRWIFRENDQNDNDEVDDEGGYGTYGESRTDANYQVKAPADVYGRATPLPAADLPAPSEQSYSGAAANSFTPLGTWYPEQKLPPGQV